MQGLNPDETAGLDWLRNYNPASQLPGALQGVGNYMNTGPSYERIVDENGQLGKISDYINPFIQANLAPTLRGLREAFDQQAKTTNRMATMGGAFGDARHGIREVGEFDKYQQGVGDVTGRAFYQAWNDAMGGRLSDINRFNQEKNLAAQRQLEGSKTLMNVNAMDQQQQLQLLREKLAGGERQRAVDQAGLTANYGEFLRQQEEQQRRIQQLASVLGTVPHNKTVDSSSTSTQTQVQPDNSGLALGGALLQAALAPMTGGASMMMGSMMGPMMGQAGASVGSQGAPAPYQGNPYNLPWLQ